MNTELIKSNIRTIPDFPKPGIVFFDVTTIFKNPDCIKELGDSLYELYKDKGITKVVGMESRGFIVGAVAAHRLGAGFVPARKPGKLPAETISCRYIKEYGYDSLEIHTDAITSDDVVLIHDDLLASGGTAAAVIELVKKFNPKAIYVNFILEITDLPGRAQLPSDIEVTSLLEVSERG